MASSFNPMATAIDWLDAYRAAAISIVQLYATDAVVECACAGQKLLTGHTALTEYWRQRFVAKPAAELENLQPDGDAVLITYRVPAGVVEARLYFDQHGKIRRSECGPAT